MNTSETAKRVLCFGDSNTWGLDTKEMEKFPPHIRWTGVLQDTLGSEYEILEEGLRSRTTNIDDSEIMDRNGLAYLRPCIESLMPIDICILWLGTNDFKARFQRKAADVAEGMREVIMYAKENLPDTAHIILVAPPDAWTTEKSAVWGFTDIEGEARALASLYRELAEELDVHFVDLIAEGVETSPVDGIHLSAQAHAQIADIFTRTIKNL